NRSLEAMGGPVAFHPMAIERLTPNPNDKGQTYEYWLKYFDQHPDLRYISDGNKDVVAVPKSLRSSVDEAKVKSEGKTLQLYSFTGPAGGAGGGGGLSVQ